MMTTSAAPPCVAVPQERLARRFVPFVAAMLDFSRHALALGFATQVIMGVGGRFVPAFSGRRLPSPGGHRCAFWLLNVAVAIRGLEAVLAAGYWAELWPLLALSGPPAVAAVALFSANLAAALRPARLVRRGRLVLPVTPAGRR
jgi:hypothetical protein